MPELYYLWQEYVNIKSGCESVGWLEIGAYQKATRRTMDSWETEAMIGIEQARKV